MVADVACKTGTPETTAEGLPNSTFICFAPADNPQIAIAVVIEKGWHGYTGAPGVEIHIYQLRLGGILAACLTQGAVGHR